MDQAVPGKLEPRFENGAPILIAGFAERITPETWDKIDALWWRFAPHIGSVPGQVGSRVAYGVVTDAGSGIEYLAGVEVSDASGLPEGFSHVQLPAQRYAVFRHDGHVTRLKETMTAIFETWLPTSGREHARRAGAPAFYERYGEEFDPRTGTGGIEVWIPIKS